MFELQTKVKSQHREHNYLLEMVEIKGILHQKKPLTGSTVWGDW